jgi:hypothetical protein
VATHWQLTRFSKMSIFQLIATLKTILIPVQCGLVTNSLLRVHWPTGVFTNDNSDQSILGN